MEAIGGELSPGGNVVTTAEHAIAMMLALTRNIPSGTASLKDGRWEKKKLQGVIEMSGAVCHEMNKQLQVVSGICELIMLDADENDPLFERLQTIYRQVEEMGRITAKLKDITRYRTKEYLRERIIDIDEASFGG